MKLSLEPQEIHKILTDVLTEKANVIGEGKTDTGTAVMRFYRKYGELEFPEEDAEEMCVVFEITV